MRGCGFSVAGHLLMSHPHWPFFDLRIRTPRLELRYPDDDLLGALGDLAASGIHTPDQMPFNEPWTRVPAGELQSKSLQHWWGRRASLTADDWDLGFAVLEQGRLVGVQDLFAKDFRIRRCFETGSWLGIEYHGRGIGTEMRAAILHLGFEGLQASVAETAAFADNPASQAVSKKLGYQPNGQAVRAREGRPATMLRFTMSRQLWEQRRRQDITIEGLEPCLPPLGLGG
jgi:RimJ/RimL family protein N-acetyltransferase